MNKKMKRPRIIINCAMTADGKIALPNKKQLRISSKEDIRRVHQLRNDCDGILVGIGAVLSDDPKLTVKDKYVENPKQPVRIVLDSHLKTPPDALVVNDKSKTIICCTNPSIYEKKFGDNVELIFCKDNKSGNIDLFDALEKLYEKDIKTILIEGGGTIIWNFLKNSLFDDFFVYIGPMIVGGKHTPTMADGEGINKIDELICLKIDEVKKIGEGILIHYVIE